MARPPDPNARETLLTAARAEFAGKGIVRARVEDIARRAGLSKGAFYLHFDSKEQAFRDIVLRFIGVLEEQARVRREREERFYAERGEVTAADVEGGSERFRAMVALECGCDIELLETMWRNREILAILEGASGAQYRELVESFRRRMGEQLSGHLRESQASGRMRGDLEPEAVGDLIMGAYEAFARRMPTLKQKPDLERWAWTVTSMICRGMMPAAEPFAVGAVPERPAVGDRPVTRRRGA